MLESLYASRAAAAIITIDNSDKIRLVCSALRDAAPNISISVCTHNRAQVDALSDLDIETIIDESELVANRLITEATQCRLGNLL